MDKKIKLMLVLLGIAISISFFSWSSSFADSDRDGITDTVDNCPNDANPEQSDFDLDELGDICDADDDNDGFGDDVDMFDTEPTEWRDSDSDLIGDNKDADDDNDGVSDSLDQFGTDPLDWADFDFDGIGTNQDTDDDNDGILDIEDTLPMSISEVLATKHLLEIETCAEISDGTLRLVCYSQFFGKLVSSEKNNSDALELSIDLSKIGIIDDCHFVSHEIGHAAYDQTKDVARSLKGMDGTMCRGGYFHGVMASYFHNIKDSGEAFPDSATLCDDLIGSSNYQDCIHGLGHGFVHYFGDDLSSSLSLCHEMSFYQDILCVKGVMMQYTDDVLTRDGVASNVISNLCDSKHLAGTDEIECGMSTGTTLAFFTNHDFNKGKQLCNLVENDDTKNLCIEGLRLEIQDSEKYESNPLTEDRREKFQPQTIQDNSKMDIRSPATVSGFKAVPEIGLISFNTDRPQYVIMYVPSEFLAPEISVTVNGQTPDQLEIKNNVLGKDLTMIRFVPSEAGMVLIAPLS